MGFPELAEHKNKAKITVNLAHPEAVSGTRGLRLCVSKGVFHNPLITQVK